jgi:hypothetical protein
MRSDPGGVRHRVAHQPADASVAIGKRVDEVESMMRRRDSHDAARHSQFFEPVTTREVIHENIDVFARRRQVAPNGDILLGAISPFARSHAETTSVARDMKERIRRVTVEVSMEPTNEVDRSRLWRQVRSREVIDLFLNPHMRRGFGLEIASFHVRIEIPRQRALDIVWPGVVAFDQVAVVGVHQPHEIGEICRRAGMQRVSERSGGAGELSDDVGYRGWRRFKKRRFNPLRGFQRFHLADRFIVNMAG